MAKTDYLRGLEVGTLDRMDEQPFWLPEYASEAFIKGYKEGFEGEMHKGQYTAMQVTLAQVGLERKAQHRKWGEQSHPNGTDELFKEQADEARAICDAAHKAGKGTWRMIAAEEFFEACAETDPTKLRTELIQLAAVCIAWCEDIDRKEAERG